MMVERHYDEEVLAAFLGEPADSTTGDRHLADCSLCRATLDSLRSTTELLSTAAVWEYEPPASSPRPETIAFLRKKQAMLAANDVVAEQYVRELLAGSRESWAPRLAAHPEWRTAGVVRKLIAATDRYNFSSPLDAVEVTRLITEIAESLPADARSVRNHLRADAWREHAYALMYVGSYPQALAAVERATLMLSDSGDGLARARVLLMRALVLRSMERWSEAAAMAREASVEFERYGDVGRQCTARMTEALIFYDSSQHRVALAVYADLQQLRDVMPSETRAMVLHNEGLCWRELGDFAAAEKCFVAAVELFERLALFGLRAKAHWHIARLQMRQNRYEAALRLLETVRREFEELGMAHDLACVSVDTAECLMALGRQLDVSRLCQSAIDYYRSAGIATTTGALTALAYLKEAAVSGTLTMTDVGAVRIFFERLPKQPHLAFAAPGR